MKLDKLKFAKLVSYISAKCGYELDPDDIDHLDEIVDINVPEAKADTIYPQASDVNALMALMAAGTQKIEAIRLHRKLTGYGLKESKDAVEEFWVSRNVID